MRPCFYTGKLGLKVTGNPDDGAVVFEAGGDADLQMYQQGKPTTQHTALTVLVSDIEAIVDGLLAKGIARGESNIAAWLTDSANKIIARVKM